MPQMLKRQSSFTTTILEGRVAHCCGAELQKQPKLTPVRQHLSLPSSRSQESIRKCYHHKCRSVELWHSTTAHAALSFNTSHISNNEDNKFSHTQASCKAPQSSQRTPTSFQQSLKTHTDYAGDFRSLLATPSQPAHQFAPT